METFTEDSSRMESWKEKALTGGPMARSIEAASKADYCMAWESGCRSRMIIMKESTDRTKSMDLGPINGVTE